MFRYIHTHLHISQHFQRQQELFRRQRQDQERIRQQNQQHQDRLRREEEQRRQQQLLRNLQHSNTTSVGETGGTTVVHVAPGIQVELSGFTVNESLGAEGVRVLYNFDLFIV